MGSRVVNNVYIGTAGGHMEKDELNDAKKCILRELEEETGLTIKDISNPNLRYVTLRYKNGEIRQNYYFFSQLINKKKNIKSNEGELNWFSEDQIKELKMPHTAKYVVNHYINEGKHNESLYAGVAVINGMKFVELKDFQ